LKLIAFGVRRHAYLIDKVSRPFSALDRVTLIVVLAAVVVERLALSLGVWERAGGAGRDRPESRMPGRLAARRASGPPQADRLEPVKKL
jgi:hypothetical protein